MNHPEGTFFHLSGWGKVVAETFRHKAYYLVAEKNSEIRGILPSFMVKSLFFGRGLISVAFGAYGGVLALDEEALRALLNKARDITQQENLHYFETRNLYRREAGLSVKDLYYTFRREIFPRVEDNFEAIPRKARRMVRVGADKFKLKAENGREKLLPEFCEIYARSVHYLGSPVYPKTLFRNLLREFKRESKILVVRTPAGKAVAGVMFFFYKDEVLPYYAGSLSGGKEMAANDFMYWELMKHGCENGYKIFDFGRSKKGTGAFNFKRHWGFEPRRLHYQYYLHRLRQIPNISPANHKYQRCIGAWKRLPLPVTKILGPMIAKYIP